MAERKMLKNTLKTETLALFNENKELFDYENYETDYSCEVNFLCALK